LDAFDYIVVGAGSAGCVLAERLSANPAHRVLVLEAGGDDRRFWVKTPIGYGKTFYHPTLNWRYTAEPDPGLGGRATYWPRGKVLGGSSSINALVYSRGRPADYDDWCAAGNPGWSWSDVEPVFRSFERRIRADGTALGEGPLYIADRETEYHPIKRHLYDAAREIGLPIAGEDGAAEGEGVAAYAITTRGGVRCSAADAFLRPAMARRNLEVRLHCHVHRILFTQGRATGIEYRRGETLERVAVRAEIVVAAGAVNSPQLLQLSGIGPPALLQELGIGVVYGNPAVGGALQDHIGIDYLFRASEPTLNGVLGTWSGRLGAGLRFLVARKGPLSLSVNQMGGIVPTGPDAAAPMAQLYFNPLSYSTKYVGRRPLLQPDPFPGFILGFNPCRPRSTGRIDLRSADPAAPPKIMPNYLSNNQDIADVIRCGRLIGRLLGTRALRQLIVGPRRFDVCEADDAEILADFRARCSTVYHPCGTCRMVPETNGGVVDRQCRVYGVAGLRVVDASIFPNITSANTNAPTIMVAHRAAAFIGAR
jgi:choline dehydrogenase